MNAFNTIACLVKKKKKFFLVHRRSPDNFNMNYSLSSVEGIL